MMMEHSDAAIASDAGSVPESDGTSNDEGYIYCIIEYEGGVGKYQKYLKYNLESTGIT